MAIFHLARPEEWAEATASGRLAPASLAAEGFVHCSTGEQLPGTVARHHPDAEELVILRLDDAGLRADLRWEESRPGESYPHVYRALALGDVVEVILWHRGDEHPA